jgi:serine/threonine-protein kinase HipA
MSLPEIKYCPGTLAEGFNTYSRACLNRVFESKKVYHVLPYESPASNPETDDLFQVYRKNSLYCLKKISCGSLERAKKAHIF